MKYTDKNITIIEPGFIEWLGYDRAIISTQVAAVKTDRSGNTWVLSTQGRVFNVHPRQYECGWKPETAMKYSSGCYPIRWEHGFNAPENETAEQFFNNLI